MSKEEKKIIEDPIHIYAELSDIFDKNNIQKIIQNILDIEKKLRNNESEKEWLENLTDDQKKMPYFELSVSPEPYNTNLDVSEPVEGEDYPVENGHYAPR